MDRTWPALDVRDVDRADFLLAILDQFEPTAAEERRSSLRVFFRSPDARDAAARAALAQRYDVRAIDVPDGDWARRSQENLGPVTVGRITILPAFPPSPLPPSSSPLQGSPDSAVPPHPRHLKGRDSRQMRQVLVAAVTIVIPPSMGFGTGHHGTTRLCLTALQTLDLANAFVLDVGTGSGVLAIAAVRLGARRALGIDTDLDAIQAARENLSWNPQARNVGFEVADLVSARLPEADIVTANLTGELLTRAATLLAGARGPKGTLIVSGLVAAERAKVLSAFSGLEVVWEGLEQQWLGFALR